MKEQYIVTFHTHYEALCCKRAIDAKLSNMVRGDDHPQTTQIESKLIPVPRALSSSCGTALSVKVKNLDAKDIAFIFECEHDEIYTLDEKGEYHLEDACL